MSMRKNFATDEAMADNDSPGANNTSRCCSGQPVTQGTCLSVTNELQRAQSSIATVRQKVSFLTSAQFFSFWRCADLFVNPVIATSLTALLLLLPLSAVVTSLMCGPHGIHTTSSSPQLSEACEDSSLDDDVLSFTYPWQLLAKVESVVAHLFPPLLEFAFLTVDLPIGEQTGVRTVSHERAPPLPWVTCNV